MLDESLRVTRRPKPGVQLFLMCFSGYGVKRKRLMHTVAMQKPNEIESLGKSRRLRGSGRDLGVMANGVQLSPKTRVFFARGITSGSIWFSRFRPGYEVRDFSITPSLIF
jgi:hypothetical protein